jgi:hypothetical protein
MFPRSRQKGAKSGRRELSSIRLTVQASRSAAISQMNRAIGAPGSRLPVGMATGLASLLKNAHVLQH